MQLNQMIGETLLGDVPSLSSAGSGDNYRFKLVSVDTGGIWVESQSLIEHFLHLAKTADAPESPVFFLPFSSINYLVHLHDAKALSQKSLRQKPR
jgi:hypothetical protein